MKKRKNYYQVHLNKRPKGKLHPQRNLIRMIQFCTEIVLSTVKTVKAIREFQESISKVSEIVEATAGRMLAMKHNAIIEGWKSEGGKGNYPQQTLNLKPEDIKVSFDPASENGDKTAKVTMSDNGNIFNIEIVNTDEIESIQIPTDEDVIKAMKRQIERIGYTVIGKDEIGFNNTSPDESIKSWRDGGHFPLKSDLKFRPTAGAVCVQCGVCCNHSSHNLKGSTVCDQCWDKRETKTIEK